MSFIQWKKYFAITIAAFTTLSLSPMLSIAEVNEYYAENPAPGAKIDRAAKKYAHQNRKLHRKVKRKDRAIEGSKDKETRDAGSGQE